LHEELSGKCEEDDVECHELKVLDALAVLDRRIRTILSRRQARVGEVNAGVQWIVSTGTDEIGGQYSDEDDQRNEPGVSQRHANAAPEKAACFPPFRMRF